ncbi:glycosyltransferase family 4 protein [Cyanobium gracile UHCC 0139]|uniref:Glycosyltransferase family 4 protein n=1 Tax=Cyanobium gracile UHCC 0139 TaxID=3110308 RepID=A0ABU5RRS2_9CYAN|nr:glycosyltransferase family 4 protein [Cyanobium gracile]MEA5390454.1 glycosyltransferase family 4 protein [Cyanobium gracile UHCC 0139]
MDLAGDPAPLRIALTAPRIDPESGGLARWVGQFAAHLGRRGHDVHLVGFEAGPVTLPAEAHRLRDPGDPWARARAVAACLGRLGPDLVHDSGVAPQADVFQPATGSERISERAVIAAGDPCHRLKARVSPKVLGRHRAMASLERHQCRQAGSIIAMSALVRDLLLDLQPLPAHRIQVIHNGVDTQVFHPEARQRRRLSARRHLGVGDEPLFLLVAHNLLLKGADTAIAALARLPAGSRARLAIAGGEPDATWRQRVRRAGLDGRVLFLGPGQDIPLLHAAADALVHPSRWDACSLVTIEAMASGLPVITTRRNGASELIKDGQSGFLVPAAAEAVLADRLQRLLDAPVRARMGAAARVAALAHDLETSLAAVEAVLLARRSRSRV